MRLTPLLRTATLALLVVAVFAASGCRWFRRNNPYNQSAETRPLEVPPDLDRPSTAAALGAPTSVTRSGMAGTPVQGAAPAQSPAGQPAAAQPAAAQGPAVPASGSGFTVPGERDAVFNQVGEALAAVPGATIASKAQLLGTYDVNYEGSNFLVRVTKVDAGVYVSAVDPRGVAAGGEAAAKLMAALRTALGG
jgi:uncharacterized lipoprotein